jgi:hypothetical protein
VFDFAQTLLDYPDHTAIMRALAAEHHLSLPERQQAGSSDVLDRAAQFYAGRLTTAALRYLTERGFPEAVVRQHRIGYAPVSPSRDLLIREIRSTTRSNRTKLLREAIEAGLVVQDKASGTRDFFVSETTDTSCFRRWSKAAWWISRAGRFPPSSSQRLPQPARPDPPLVQRRGYRAAIGNPRPNVASRRCARQNG